LAAQHTDAIVLDSGSSLPLAETVALLGTREVTCIMIGERIAEWVRSD
jgi:hypothetical protein